MTRSQGPTSAWNFVKDTCTFRVKGVFPDDLGRHRELVHDDLRAAADNTSPILGSTGRAMDRRASRSAGQESAAQPVCSRLPALLRA